ncbi:MAG: tetratricopeptide repeat protein, partial [Longimicrobiales bacterium]
VEVVDAAVDEASETDEAIEAAFEDAAADASADAGDEEPETTATVTEHHRLFEDGDVAGAIDSLRALIDREPDVGDHHQRMVEYAFRLNEPSALASAYLGLAQCLQRAGSDTQARPVFEQVLLSDPENAEAKAALGQVAVESEEVTEVASSEDYVDLGALLLDDEEKSTRMVVAYEEPTGDEEADFKRMLSQFKEKVSENIEADDVGAHYDLGTAYKEMGLIDEAIGEFQQALRASADHLPTYEVLGQAFIEKGEFEAAIRSLTRALDTPHEIEDELLGIYYYLGLSHQEMGNTELALEFYDRVFSLDINFRDVTERIHALRD